MRDHRRRLRDILEAIGHIERYAVRGREAFNEDELIQNWCLRHLQIIGEAVRALPDEIRRRSPSIPWSQIAGMRHVLVHDYFEIDADLVWDTVERDLPKLRRQIETLLAVLEGESQHDASYAAPGTEQDQ